MGRIRKIAKRRKMASKKGWMVKKHHFSDKGPFKCYVTQMGVGGCQIFRKKALRRCNVQCYYRYEGVGGGPISSKIALRNT